MIEFALFYRGAQVLRLPSDYDVFGQVMQSSSKDGKPFSLLHMDLHIV